LFSKLVKMSSFSKDDIFTSFENNILLNFSHSHKGEYTEKNMFVPFENIALSSRLWIYQAQRPLNEDEIQLIGTKLQNFTQHWEAHQQPLRASFQIFHKQFVCLAVDEQKQNATGCSIDKSVAIMREIGETLQVDFFDRLAICYMADETVKTAKVAEIKSKITSGEFAANTMVFDNTIQEKKSLNAWLKPAEQTWLKKYLA
jgi:hypothetical protein